MSRPIRPSSVNNLNRLYASLPYLIPITTVFPFGALFLFIQFPFLKSIFLPVSYLYVISKITIADFISIRFASWICLFIFVVKNYRVSHFVRFNAAQSIFLFIIVELVNAIIQVLDVVFGQSTFFPFVVQIICTITFLSIVAAFIYAIFYCVRGRYAEMPMISELAYRIVR